MRTGFYIKLALDGIKKNRRMYVPYGLSGCCLTAMTYILFFLTASEVLEYMKGGSVLRMLLPAGILVVCLFALIFMFYSNSFLLRQRNCEFGLYNVLGMDKNNLSRIIFWDNTIICAASVLTGLILGIVLSKLAELGMVNLLKENVSYTLRIDFMSVLKTTLVFLGIYAMLFLNSIIKVRRSSALTLLAIASAGERAPRVNWLFATVGVLILGAAYYIALSIKQPLTAIVWFMAAVIMVIIATYLLFISGSVALCRVLQRNKRYYYKANHFVSVSSMAYRMRRNGAGLASICVLITIVLVMLSSTISLYCGAEDSIKTNNPEDIAVTVFLPDMDAFNEESFSKMRKAVNEKLEASENVHEYCSVEIAGLLIDDQFLVDQEEHAHFNLSTYEDICYLNIITIDDYNRIMSENETLQEGECLIYSYRTEYSADTITIENCEQLKVKTHLKNVRMPPYMIHQMVPIITLVVNDIPQVFEPLFTMHNIRDISILEPCWSYSFDVDGSADEQLEVYEKLRNEIDDIAILDKNGSYAYSIECREEARTTFYSLYGALFFIGILLSVVFVLAAVLIIYYKQISEGYEDQKRFEVMQKVGMTKKEIRSSINAQILTVFFAPLVLAGVHLAVAFPIIWKLMQMFMLENVMIMIVVTGISYVVFALVYALVYKITSNAYYSIVSGVKTAESY